MFTKIKLSVTVALGLTASAAFADEVPVCPSLDVATATLQEVSDVYRIDPDAAADVLSAACPSVVDADSLAEVPSGSAEIDGTPVKFVSTDGGVAIVVEIFEDYIPKS